VPATVMHLPARDKSPPDPARAAVRDKHERAWTGPSASALHAKQPCRDGLSRRRVTLGFAASNTQRVGRRAIAMRDIEHSSS
jgi:hypothetical protein